jgi:hypothetical protein
MRLVIRLLVLAGLLGAASLPVTAAAQGSPAFERVEVALWPEYDQRAMLVIYRVTLDEGATLPATISIPIPARVGEPAAVAQQGGDGILILANYTRLPGTGDWASLEIQAENPQIQIEFYDTLSMDVDQRDYTLLWPGGWPVGELAFEVQQPFGVASMQIEPSPAGDRLGPDGLTYYTGSLGVQDGTADARLDVGYTASASGLTIDALPAAAGDETPAIGSVEPSGQGSVWLEWAPWGIGGLGATLLIVGAVLFLRSRKEESGSRRIRHRSIDRSAADSQTIDASSVFCHSCGTPAGVTDVFCRKCGTRLRV